MSFIDIVQILEKMNYLLNTLTTLNLLPETIMFKNKQNNKPEQTFNNK